MHIEIRAHPTKTWGVTFGVEVKGISGRENSTSLGTEVNENRE